MLPACDVYASFQAILNGHTETADALRALGAVNASHSFLEAEWKRCSQDNQKRCSNATLDCPNFGKANLHKVSTPLCRVHFSLFQVMPGCKLAGVGQRGITRRVVSLLAFDK